MIENYFLESWSIFVYFKSILLSESQYTGSLPLISHIVTLASLDFSRSVSRQRPAWEKPERRKPGPLSQGIEAQYDFI